MKRLLEIDVSFCPKITSTAVKHLAEGKTTFTLTALNLFHTAFTNEGCKSLTCNLFRKVDRNFFKDDDKKQKS